MPQSGFHGLVGLATARAFIRRVTPVAQTAFVVGTVIGSVLPDIDMYPTVIAVALTGDDSLIYKLHRTAAHSIFVVLLFALLGLFSLKSERWRWLWYGLAIGALTHEVLDIFFWFAQLDVMWPLSHLPSGHPYFQVINVWTSSHSGVASNIRDAFEFAAFALFLMAVRRIVMKVRGYGRDLAEILKWEAALWIFFVAALVVAFSSGSNVKIQQILVNVPYLLAFLPFCWSRVWVYRKEITAWCRYVEMDELAIERRQGQEWHDWDGSQICTPSAIEFPRTVEETVGLVKSARESGATIRTFGAGHSWSALVPTDGILVNLDLLEIRPPLTISGNRATFSAGTRFRDLGPMLQAQGKTPINVGAITPQSFAGAMGTGTHGTGRAFGVLGTQVVEMKIIDGTGALRTYGGNDPEMAALRLSLGSLGIIVEVTVECVDDYNVELVKIPMSYDQFLAEFDQLYLENERVRAYWFPGSKRVWVNIMRRTDKPAKPGSVFTWFEANVERGFAMGTLWSVGRTWNSVIPICNRIQEMTGYVKGSVVGHCFDAITTPIPPLHQEAEVAVPIERGRDAFVAYKELVEKEGFLINVESEVRFSKADDILLSPGDGRDTCYIGGYTSTYRPNDPFFSNFCDALRQDFDGRPHWGKIGAPTRAVAQAAFPRFSDFEKFRREFDPEGVFLNNALRELFGL